MVAWLAQMIPGVDGGARDPEGMKRAFQRLEMYGALIDVVYRATGTHYEAGRNVPGTYGGTEENVVDQIRDSLSRESMVSDSSAMERTVAFFGG